MPSTKGKAKQAPTGEPRGRTTNAAAKAAGQGKRAAKTAQPRPAASRLADSVPDAATALGWLEEHATPQGRESLARFGIVTSSKVLGVSMAHVHSVAKRTGRSHELAAALWASDCYEARLLCSFVDEPSRVTVKQMDAWCRESDNWALIDTLCFHLFDRTPHAWSRIEAWSSRREEFVKRGAFALLASLAGHDKGSDDAPYLEALTLIEAAASDERNFVKKAVLWALRRVGGRSPASHKAAIGLAQELAASTSPSARWIGKETLRELNKPAVLKLLAKRK